MPNITNITPPRVAIIDLRTGAITREWYRFFYNLFYATGGENQGSTPVDRGGTGTNVIPTNGQILIGNGTTQSYTVNDLTTGSGIGKTVGAGTLEIENTGVLSFSGGSTGLTPAIPTTGDIVLDGILGVANGGTGQSTYEDGELLIGNSTGNTLAKATLTQGAGIVITNGAGSITIASSESTPPVVKTTDFTVADTDAWLISNKSSACTVTLPVAADYPGRILHFQNYQNQTVVSASSNVVPITGGAAGTAILSATAGQTATLVSNGTNWLITQK